MALTSLPCPYATDEYLDLTFANGSSTRVKIVETKTFTLSCVVLVQVECSAFRGHAILKSYDRRFATQLRRDEGAAPWNQEIEQKYQEYVHEGHEAKDVECWSARFREDEYWEDEQRENWTEAQDEAYLQFCCQRAYRIECRAYELMKEMQAKRVPRVLGKVTVVPSVEPKSTSGSLRKYSGSPGILLQYIEGFPLTDLADRVPQEYWQRICDDAIATVHKIGDVGICNRDVHTRSIIVNENMAPGDFKVFMIDFGLCVFREDFEDKREFERWQANEDEEGAIGCVMEKRLKPGYDYHRSARAFRLLDEYMREDSD